MAIIVQHFSFQGPRPDTYPIVDLIPEVTEFVWRHVQHCGFGAAREVPRLILMVSLRGRIGSVPPRWHHPPMLVFNRSFHPSDTIEITIFLKQNLCICLYKYIIKTNPKANNCTSCVVPSVKIIVLFNRLFVVDLVLENRCSCQPCFRSSFCLNSEQI